MKVGSSRAYLYCLFPYTSITAYNPVSSMRYEEQNRGKLDGPVTSTTFPERSGMSSTDHCGFGGKACTRVESAVPILHSNPLAEWLYRNYCCEDAEGLYRRTTVVAAVGHYFRIGWGIKPGLAWTSSAETSRGLFHHR